VERQVVLGFEHDDRFDTPLGEGSGCCKTYDACADDCHIVNRARHYEVILALSPGKWKPMRSSDSAAATIASASVVVGLEIQVFDELDSALSFELDEAQSQAADRLLVWIGMADDFRLYRHGFGRAG